MNLSVLLSLPRSVYYNLKCLPFSQAVKLPILNSRGVKLRGAFHKGFMIIDAPGVHRGMVSWGVTGGYFEMSFSMSSYICVSEEAKIVFHGSCLIASCIKIYVSRSGELHIGKGMLVNSSSIISSNTLVSFGNGISTEWNIKVIDWDGHEMVDVSDGSVVNAPKPIVIEDYCWLGSHSTLLKGVRLAHHCIIPYGSIISKSCDTPVSVYVGMLNHVLCIGKMRTDICVDLCDDVCYVEK